jgi:peptidoglycan/xylan/chitin deacetylase (PgdA/CDA1 family)
MNSILALLALVYQAASTPAPSVDTIPARYQGQVVAGPPRGFTKKIVALTFDDGPDKAITPSILKILKAEKVKGTFYVLGAMAKHNHAGLRQVSQEGHCIAHHSWTHPSKTSPASAANEIKLLNDLVQKVVGKTPTSFRPPYGIVSGNMVPIVKKQKMAVVLWSVDTLDWKAKSSGYVRDRALKGAAPGAIILMHDGYKKKFTVQALPAIIAGLKKRGYTFATVPELLHEYDKHVVAYAAAQAKKKAEAAAKKKAAASAKKKPA